MQGGGGGGGAGKASLGSLTVFPFPWGVIKKFDVTQDPEGEEVLQDLAKSLHPSLRKLVTTTTISHISFFARMKSYAGIFGEKMEDSAALVLDLITLFSYT